MESWEKKWASQRKILIEPADKLVTSISYLFKHYFKDLNNWIHRGSDSKKIQESESLKLLLIFALMGDNNIYVSCN